MHSSLSVKIKNLLQSSGLIVKTLHTTDKFSTFEVSFAQFNFSRNLIVWNKEFINSNDYLDLYNITSKFTRGKWLIVGNKLLDNNGEDKWEQFQIQTKKILNNNMSYSDEYEIFDILKEEYFNS